MPRFQNYKLLVGISAQHHNGWDPSFRGHGNDVIVDSGIIFENNSVGLFDLESDPREEQNIINEEKKHKMQI